MRRVLAMLVLAHCVLSSAAFADPILIEHSFDDLMPGPQAYRREQLLLFSSLDGASYSFVHIVASPYATTPPNVVMPAIEGWDVAGLFVSTENPGFTLGTWYMGFEVTGPQQAGLPWSLSIFDSAGTVLGMMGGTGPAAFAWIREVPDIASFSFHPGDPSRGLDFIRHYSAVTPEPSTLVLMLSGVAAATAIRGRRLRRR